MLKIIWNEQKRLANITNHKVDFIEASEIFSDSLAVILPDDEHSVYEKRFYITGETYSGKLLVVFYTEREDTIRIISARKPTKKEKTDYEETS
jgi:uncharacterized protein